MTLNVSVRLPPFTVITDVRLSVVELDFTSIVYLKTVAEAETVGVTTHQSWLLVTSNVTFDFTESVFVPPALEKLIPFARMFSEIVISGVTGSLSSLEHAAAKAERAIVNSNR